MQQIKVNIDAEGNIKVQAGGVVGNGCAALTRAIERELGQVSQDVKKPEYFQRSNQQQRTGAG